MVIDTNPLDLVMEVASIILPFSYEKGREREREREGEGVTGGSPSIDSA